MGESKIRTSEKIEEIAAALCEAQKKFSPAFKTSENPFYSKGERLALYADMGEIIEACIGPLNENGICVMQHPSQEFKEDAQGDQKPYVTVTTRLQHKSGQFIESDFSLPASTTKYDAQSCGSATTYACRYALQSILTIKRYDDDGEAASAVRSKEASEEVAKRKTEAGRKRKQEQQASGPVQLNAVLLTQYFPESNTFRLIGDKELLKAHRELLLPYWNDLAKAVVVPEDKLDDLRWELEKEGVGLRPLKENA